MKKFWDKYAFLLFLGLILVFVIFVNLDSSVVMGIDNASPYFYPLDILKKISGTNAWVYGGIVWLALFSGLFSLVGFTASAISQLYCFLMLVLGVFSVFALVQTVAKSLVKRRIVKGSNSVNLIAFVSAIFYLCSLLTMWVFSQPNVIFIAAYGTVPALVWLLSRYSKQEYLKLNLFNKVVHIFMIVITLVFFSITFFNLVAFISYVIQIILLVLILRCYLIDLGDSSNEKKIKSRLNVEILQTVMPFVALFVLILIGLQTIQIFNGNNAFILSSFPTYVRALTETEGSRNITQDLIASEKMSSLINVTRYATAWLELHNFEGESVFQYYRLYRYNLAFIILGFIPFVLVLVGIFDSYMSDKKIPNVLRILAYFMFGGFLLISNISVSILSKIPYINIAFRWISSKWWPIYILPMVLLSAVFFMKFLNRLLDKIANKKNLKKYQYFAILTLTVVMIFYSFPIFNGNLLSTKVNVSEEYLQLNELVEQDSSLLCLPEPLSAYFRQYSWGYFGSNFVIYLVDGSVNVVDEGLMDSEFDYSETIEEVDLNSCDIQSLEEFDYILLDKSVLNEVESNNYLWCLENSDLKVFNLLEENSYYNLYSVEK